MTKAYMDQAYIIETLKKEKDTFLKKIIEKSRSINLF